MSKLSRACLYGSGIALAVAGYVYVQPAQLDARSFQGPAPRLESDHSPTPVASDASAQRALLDKYCVTCHNQRLKTAGLTLDTVQVGQVGHDAEIWEKVVRKLQAGAMPPAGRPRPDEATLHSFVSGLVTALDRAAAEHPNPGRPTIRRLNRPEYTNVIRDLLGVEIDARTLLPSDNIDHGFDNIGDALSASPGLLESYLSAARKIARLAVGDPTIIPAFTEYKAAPWPTPQDQRTSDELPFGSRGGMVVRHNFPLDADYVVKVSLLRTRNQEIRGLSETHDIEVRLDGQRVALLTVGIAGRRVDARDLHEGDANLEVRIPVKAGRHVVGVSFPAGQAALLEGVIQPLSVDQELNNGTAGLPAVGVVAIGGPYNSTGPGDTPSRRRIFVCRPTTGAEEEPCAKRILATLARRAYRRPVTEQEVQTTLSFYRVGRAEGSFDAGIQFALERLLSDPNFLFRLERDPSNVARGTLYRLSDLELASRLSFFLWNSVPDDELLDVAAQGKLKDSTVLNQQVRRMLRDSRSKTLVTNFAEQWLTIRNIREVTPDADMFPQFDDNLRDAFQRETELFLESQLSEDRSVFDLLTANYTFVNEQLAQYYQIPNVYGSRFRRVTMIDDARRGLLGQGSFLTVTSHPDRTSPVVRGKWVLEALLGTPPPPPPPNVPGLKVSAERGKPASVREAMEEHRKNPVCASCHAQMDPLGFALENFDAIGRWRTTDGNQRIDTKTALADGTVVDGVAGLRDFVWRHRDEYVRTVTEKLLTYALGRPVEYYDAPTIRKITRDAAASDDRWSSLIIGLVNSIPFQMSQ